MYPNKDKTHYITVIQNTLRLKAKKTSNSITAAHFVSTHQINNVHVPGHKKNCVLNACVSNWSLLDIN